MVFLKLAESPNKALSNILLFISTFMFIFLAPLFPDHWLPYFNNVMFSILFFSAVYALNHVQIRMLVLAIIAFITQWIAIIFEISSLVIISDFTNVIFFQVIIIQFIIQIAKSKEVTTDVIFESINGYLLMGVMFASWLAILLFFLPNSFNSFESGESNLQNIFYFTFVTMTTLGYGEITPQIPIAKSLAILISTCGQLYIAIIIAMLVGKFAGNMNTKEK